MYSTLVISTSSAQSLCELTRQAKILQSQNSNQMSHKPWKCLEACLVQVQVQVDKMQWWWWVTGSVSAGSRLATGDCNCSDLMFHHPMPLVEAGRGLVMASGRVGGLRAAQHESVWIAGSWRPDLTPLSAFLWKKSLLVVLATFNKF